MQRVRANAAAPSSARSRSPAPVGLPPLVRSWLSDWAWGKKSAIGIVNDASAYCETHRNSRTDARIKRLAATKSNPQNAERVVESIVPVDTAFQPHEIKDSSVQWVLLPDVTFDWLQTNYPRQFQIHMGAARGGVQEFWEKLRGTPSGRAMWDLHPWLRGKSPGDLRYHVPLAMFDDDGPISNLSSAYVRQFYSVLGTGSDKETRYLLSTGISGSPLPDESWLALMPSFEKLASPRAEGLWGGVLIFFCADLDYVCNTFGLPHFNAENCCSLCLANNSTRPHNKYSSSAGWKGTEVDNVTFKARLRRPLHPCVAHPWFGVFTYRHDLLHMADHHGIASHICANILWAHLSSEREGAALPGGTMDERLDFLNSDVRAFYSMNDVQNRLPSFKEDNIKGGDWPELRGNNGKAANTRAFVPYCLALQKRAVELVPSTKNKHMLKVVEALHTIFDIVYSAPCFFEQRKSRPLGPDLR